MRLVGNSAALHRLSQILGLDKLKNLLQIIYLNKDNELTRVIDVSKKMISTATVSLARGFVLIKDRLPALIVCDFMSCEYLLHSIYPLFVVILNQTDI